MSEAGFIAQMLEIAGDHLARGRVDLAIAASAGERGDFHTCYRRTCAGARALGWSIRSLIVVASRSRAP